MLSKRIIQPVRDHTEELLQSILRDAGGIARTGAIHNAVYDRQTGERPYDYVKVTHGLKSSPMLRQDFGRGVWNLSAEERESLPLLGQWAAWEFEHTGAADWFEVRDTFFGKVGTAFAEARNGEPIEAVADDPVIRALLTGMAKRPALVNAVQSLTVAGVEDDAIHRHMYAMLEDGHRGMHMSAAADFYRDCAARFGVDPAALSRGETRA